MNNPKYLLSGSTSRLLDEFKALDIEAEILNVKLNLIRYRNVENKWQSLKGMVSEKLPVFSLLAANDKWWCHKIMTDLGMPNPHTLLYEDLKEAEDFIMTYKKVVVKPKSAAHGHGINLNVSSSRMMIRAIKKAQEFSEDVLIQEQLEGRDIRLLFIGGNLVSALEKTPASVVGDGIHTVWELIQIENTTNTDRGVLGVDIMVKISEGAAKDYLSPAELNAVLPKNTIVRVVGPANQSLGGTFKNVLGEIDKKIIKQALKIVNYLRMPIAGVDYLQAKTGHSFLEVNASPGIGIHDSDEGGIRSDCFNTYALFLYNQKA